MNHISRIESLLMALWVGCMVGVGYIAAPVLFKVLDDRSLAGSLAGQMFNIVAIVGLVVGLLLLLSYLLHFSMTSFREWRFWLLALMVALVLVSLFVLQPMIAEVKASGITPGSEGAKRFGSLHGISSILYMATTVAGALLIYAGLRPGKKRLRARDINQL